MSNLIRFWNSTTSAWEYAEVKKAEDATKLGGKLASDYAEKTQVTSDIKVVDDKIGDMTTLTTANKDTLVKALNEIKTAMSSIITIDDTKQELTSTWSSQKIKNSLDGKADATHGHTVADITDFVNQVKSIIDGLKGVNDGIAGLDSTGKIPTSLLPSSIKEGRVVADITARNAIADKFEGLHVLVLDATGDATVKVGYAEYVYDGTAWKKVSEGESMDLVLDWVNIVGKPTSSASDIDDAVTKKHSHANSTVLNDLSDDSGSLAYKGVKIPTSNEAVVASITEPTNKSVLWIDIN